MRYIKAYDKPRSKSKYWLVLFDAEWIYFKFDTIFSFNAAILWIKDYLYINKSFDPEEMEIDFERLPGQIFDCVFPGWLPDLLLEDLQAQIVNIKDTTT